MPKKPRKESDLTIIRKGMGLSQPDFARRLGVSASTIKKLEEGKRTMSQDLQARLHAETGVMFINGYNSDGPVTYTKEDHTEWLNETQLNQRQAAAAARTILKLAELMLVAASRPGVQKSLQVFNGLLQAMERTKNEFHLEKHIDAELRERHSTETKLYSVRELRANDLLAGMVGFKDDQNLKDDETLPLTKTTGWFPTKEIFNIWWQHRQFIGEMLKMEDPALSDEARTKLESKLEQIEKQIDSEMDAFKPSGPH